MKAFLGTCLLAVCLAVSVKADDTSDKPTAPKSSEVDVQASSDLRVAVVDMAPATPERDALHEAFAKSFSASMSKQCGGKVNVKITETDAVSVAFEMKSGSYDVVFVVGNNVPPALRKGDYEVLRASAEMGGPTSRVFHMVVPSDDPSLPRMVAQAFPEALNNQKFQEAATRAVAIKVNADAVKKAAKESVVDSIR